MTGRFLAKAEFPDWVGKEGMAKERGEYKVATNADRTIANVVWRDKAVVRLTANIGCTNRVYIKRRQRGKKAFLVKAPALITMYDQYFHGVDRNDQLRGRGNISFVRNYNIDQVYYNGYH